MKQKVVFGLAVVFLAGISGCGGGIKTHDDVMKEGLKATDEVIEVLDSIKDEASAKAAIPKLEAITKRMEEVQKKAKELGEPSKEVQEELRKKYEPQMLEKLPKLEAALKKVEALAKANPELQKALEAASKK